LKFSVLYTKLHGVTSSQSPSLKPHVSHFEEIGYNIDRKYRDIQDWMERNLFWPEVMKTWQLYALKSSQVIRYVDGESKTNILLLGCMLGVIKDVYNRSINAMPFPGTDIADQLRKLQFLTQHSNSWSPGMILVFDSALTQLITWENFSAYICLKGFKYVTVMCYIHFVCTPVTM
jgi:hypothetical protein